jgi:hypothetical protein
MKVDGKQLDGDETREFYIIGLAQSIVQMNAPMEMFPSHRCLIDNLSVRIETECMLMIPTAKLFLLDNFASSIQGSIIAAETSSQAVLVLAV